MGARLAPSSMQDEGDELMRNSVIGCAFALFASATLAVAQNAKVATDTKVKSDNGTVITLIGCVEIGGGTSFVLTNITSEREQHGAKTPSPAASYALLERKGLDLGPYIQQKVELTGVVVPAATSRD